MEMFNFYGLIIMVIIMIPNIVYALKSKDGFENKWENKYIELIEQIGRFGCFAFMIINVPGTYFGFLSNNGFLWYLVVNASLVGIYCLIWIICFNKQSIFKALTLSIIPSVIFLFSGIISRSVLLIISALLFAFGHITISYNNTKAHLDKL